MADFERNSHWIVRSAVVSTVVANVQSSRTLPPIVTLTYFCVVVTVMSSTHPVKQYQSSSRFPIKCKLATKKQMIM